MSIHTLYGDSRSGNCYKAALILRLSGRPFQWHEIDAVSGATRSPGFLALNPNGKVPLLQAPDGRLLAESNAMLLHLAEGTAYLPADAWSRALAYQWLFFEQYSHEPYIAVARFILRFTGPEARDAKRLAALHQRGYAALAVMEQSLERTPFFAGDAFSVADIALYAYTHVAAEGGFDLQRCSAVCEWLSRVESQPGFLAMAEACR